MSDADLVSPQIFSPTPSWVIKRTTTHPDGKQESTIIRKKLIKNYGRQSYEDIIPTTYYEGGGLR